VKGKAKLEPGRRRIKKALGGEGVVKEVLLLPKGGSNPPVPLSLFSGKDFNQGIGKVSGISLQGERKEELSKNKN